MTFVTMCSTMRAMIAQTCSKETHECLAKSRHFF